MNKAEKSLRWVVNQIPDFKPTTNEEKMLVAIKLYSEAGAEEIKRLESENAALREKVSIVKRALREFAVQCGCDNCPFLGRCNISPDAKDDYQSCFDMYLSIAEKELAEGRKDED